MKSIIDTLEVNMGYVPGEKVAIIVMDWDEHLGEDTRIRFEETIVCGEKMFEVYKEKNIDVHLLRFIPEKARNGMDATSALYNKVKEEGFFDIVFMPTAYSLTHTKFRKTLTEQGSRVASMPGFTLEMFEEDGPMSVNYGNVSNMTTAVAQNLRESRKVHITGKGTDITVEVSEIVLESDGIIARQGSYGNLPGAEAFCVPRHGGNSNGYITVPKGWGGIKPLKHPVKFIIENGRFVDFIGESEEAQEYINEEVKPLFEEENHDVLAELGIGTNPAVTPEYVESHGWSTLVAEKVFGSAHFANGNSAAMGGQNDVPVHIDWVVPDVDIEYMR